MPSAEERVELDAARIDFEKAAAGNAEFEKAGPDSHGAGADEVLFTAPQRCMVEGREDGLRARLHLSSGGFGVVGDQTIVAPSRRPADGVAGSAPERITSLMSRSVAAGGRRP